MCAKVQPQKCDDASTAEKKYLCDGLGPTAEDTVPFATMYEKVSHSVAEPIAEPVGSWEHHLRPKIPGIFEVGECDLGEFPCWGS